MKDANGILQSHGTDELRRLMDIATPISHAHGHAHAHGATTSEPVTICHSLPDACEIALADRFVERHRHELCFVAEWKSWYEFSQGCWRPERTRRADELAKAICRETAATSEHKIATGIATARTVAAITRLAQVDRRMIATIDQWDINDWLLNTPTGTVDLRTGTSRPHDPQDFITKSTAVAPDANCPTPTWIAFLNRIFGNNPEVVSYLQRVCGYCLTGTTGEQALFFLYGSGANGKSVLLNVISGIINSYHCASPVETFMSSNSDRHPTELARLKGARLVTSSETEKGRRWADSRIKALTGGDVVAARFMRGDFFEYSPKFKLCIAGNHRPGMGSVGEAMRRRIRLIPFNETIPPHERDQRLASRLKLEWPGILAWMIEGCLRWQRECLHPPAEVVATTDGYLESEDVVSAWLSECCVVGSRHQATAAALYSSWRRWAELSGEETGSQKWLSQELDARGFIRKRTNQARGFEGVALKVE